jgi:transcription elongation factor Elf1
MTRKKDKIPSTWVAAAEQLAKDVSALVTCPSCGKATLVTRDERVWESSQTERIFECKVCGKYGSVLVANENNSKEPRTPDLPNPLREDSYVAADQLSEVVEAVRSMKKKS